MNEREAMSFKALLRRIAAEENIILKVISSKMRCLNSGGIR